MRWLLVLLVLPALAQAQQPRPATVATRVQVRGADCALFPAAMRPGLSSWWGAEEKQAPRFMPTAAQAAEAEQALPAALGQLLAAQPAANGYNDIRALRTIQAHLASYRRQYVGALDAHHQPCLLINFLYKRHSTPQDPGWLHYLIEVEDGGAGFWRIGYKLSTHRFFGFAHNPEG